MHHRTRLAILIAGTITTSIGGVLVACSTDNGTTPLPSVDSGRRDSSSSSGSTGTSGNSSGGDEDAGDQDGGVECGAPKVAKSNVGVFCRKGATNADENGYCTLDDKTICCSDAKQGTQFVKGECVAAEGDCSYPANAGGREWHCTEGGHCATGEACCAIAGDAGTQPKVFTDRCGDRNNDSDLKFVGGSRCKDTCGATDLRLCAKDEDCADGKTCKYFYLANRFAGVCE